MKFNWKEVQSVGRALVASGKKHLPTALTVVGIGGFIAAIFMAAEDGPKYQSAVKKAERDKAEELGVEEETVELTKTEKAKLVFGYFAREIAVGTLSTVAIGYSDFVEVKEALRYLGMYKAVETEFKDLRKKIVQTDGEEKLKEYEKAIHQDILNTNDGCPFVQTGHGNTVFYEPISKTYFCSDIWHVQKALREMIANCNQYGNYRLSELMSDLDLPDNDIWDYFSFYHESVNDIDVNAVEQLFDYHSIDFENGDFRPCIWLDIKNRVYYNQMNDGGGLFRAKYGDC